MKLAGKQIAAAVIAGCFGTAVLEHGGVKNAAVMARMEAMKSIGDAMKIIGAMAKGQSEFDPAGARAAAYEVARLAAQTPVLFQEFETDPKTEALPIIWERFDDFTAKALETENLAKSMAQNLDTLDDLRTGLAQVGASCKACHSDFRK